MNSVDVGATAFAVSEEISIKAVKTKMIAGEAGRRKMLGYPY